MHEFRGIPTNIISGFLGAGKTTAILHLLRNRPAGERWAVLVNEFGKVGIDGSLLTNQTDAGVSGEIFIRELAGGCMCCTNGLPMQVALNQLIIKARPDRVLIEPTGLGHPAEILEVIMGPLYRDVLSLRTVITLVDARTIHDSRYTGNTTFNEQIEVADMVVASKADLVSFEDITALQRYLDENFPQVGTVHMISEGRIELAWLDQPHRGAERPETSEDAQVISAVSDDVIEPPLSVPDGHDVVTFDNESDGFRSLGWLFGSATVFSREALIRWLSGLTALRIKGVFMTDQGIVAYNRTGDELSMVELDEAMDSRIEIIGETLSDDAVVLTAQLLACRISA